jgi:opacity protein-like surface antigen
VGYVLGNGGLLYGRVGAMQTRFNTLYRKGAGVGNWIDRSDDLSGTRYGFGAEIPASESAFVRMDYSYTRYDSVSFVTTHEGGTNPDAMEFENSESLVRLGLGFRF